MGDSQMNAQTNTTASLVAFQHKVTEPKGTGKINPKTGKEIQEYAEIGKVPYLVPTLQAFGIPAADGEPTVDDDGDLIYKDKTSQWIWEAIQAAAKSQLVSMLQPKSLDYKEGAKAWTSVEELVAGSTAIRTGQRGLLMKLRAEFKAAWATYITGLKKDPIKTATFIAIGSDFPIGGKPCMLNGLSTGSKQAVGRHLEAFFNGLNEEDQEKFAGIVTEFSLICQSAEQDLSEE